MGAGLVSSPDRLADRSSDVFLELAPTLHPVDEGAVDVEGNQLWVESGQLVNVWINQLG